MPKKKSLIVPNSSAYPHLKNSKNQDWIMGGLLIVLLLSLLTFWHFNHYYLKPKVQENIQNLQQEATVESSPEPKLLYLTEEEVDLNQDGQIDASDAAFIKAAFHQTDSKSMQADLNLDQKVDSLDYSLFSKFYQSVIKTNQKIEIGK